jgi:hypothetical protein
MASTLHTKSESSGFSPVGIPRHPCVGSSSWQRKDTWQSGCVCLWDHPQLPRHLCRAIPQAVSHRLPTAAALVLPQVRSRGICGGQVAVGQVFSEYFGFPRQFSFHRLLHIHHLSSGAGTGGELAADVPSELFLRWGESIVSPLL